MGRYTIGRRRFSWERGGHGPRPPSPSPSPIVNLIVGLGLCWIGLQFKATFLPAALILGMAAIVATLWLIAGILWLVSRIW